MKALVAIVVASATAFCLTGPAEAATGSATAGSLTVTITMNDIAFSGPECMRAPLQVTYSGPGSLEITAFKAGSSIFLFDYFYSNQAGTVSEGMQICPYVDGPGTYLLRGQINGDGVSAPLPEGLSFVVSTAPAQISRLQVRQKGRILTIIGRAIARSNRGDIGATGEVTILGRLPKSAGGKGMWVTVGTASLNEFGDFTFRGATDQRLRGAEVKVILPADEWHGDATGLTSVN